MDLTEAQLGYIMGSALLLGIVLGWPLITTAFDAIAGESLAANRLDRHQGA